MTSIEQLQVHHAALVAQRDQLMANFNASLGAISFCEQMIAETVAERARANQKAAEAVAAERVVLDPAHSLAPEMLPVISAADEDGGDSPFEICTKCTDPDYCRRFRCADTEVGGTVQL